MTVSHKLSTFSRFVQARFAVSREPVVIWSVGGIALTLLAFACASEKLAPTETAKKSSKKPITFESIYGEGDKKVDFSGSPPNGFVWLDDAHYLWPKND